MRKFDLRAKMFTFPPPLLMATGEQLFDFVAECLGTFAIENKVNNQNISLGLTFGFPVENKSLKIGILRQWTKGFNCSDTVGKNIAAMLEAAIKRKGLLVKVVAVLSDTTATLMSCIWKDPNCRIGLIVGAGVNCCYIEDTARVKKSKDIIYKPYIIINTESGGFGDGGQTDFIRTHWDKELDQDTTNPGLQTFEKMISGLYLGEFVRRVLYAAASQRIIFSGKVTDLLATNGTFDTKYVSDIARDLPGQYSTARTVLHDMGYSMPWAQDCNDLMYTCQMAWQRSVRLVAVMVSALLEHINEPNVTIGFDGHMIRAQAAFTDLLNTKIRELVNPQIKFSLSPTDDCGGLGAALVACASPLKAPTQLDARRPSVRAVATASERASETQQREKARAQLESRRQSGASASGRKATTTRRKKPATGPPPD